MVKTTKRNYIFTVQKRIGKNWRRITDAIFTKRANARECVRELRNVTDADYRVRKMVLEDSKGDSIFKTSFLAGVGIIDEQ